MQLANKDLLILSQLRKNARMSLTKMSRKTRIPVSTLFDRMNRFKACGLITKNAALVDFGKLGYGCRALIIFKVDRKDRDGMGDYLNRHRNVNSLSRVNNGWDFIAEVVFPAMKQVESFAEDVESKFKVGKKLVYYILDELKREGSLTQVPYEIANI